MGKWSPSKTEAYLKRSGKVPKFNTSIEMKVRAILDQFHISFKSQEVIQTPYSIWPYIVDFYLPDLGTMGGIIEVLGERWHSSTERRWRKTQVKARSLQDSGYLYLEIWESELKDLDAAKRKIQAFVTR